MKRTLGITARKSSKGRGAFATRAFRKGQTICVMRGRVLAKGVPKFRNRSEQLKHIDQLYTDPLQIGPARYMLLGEPYLFFNHSCAPNAGIRGTATLFALRAIRPGEEITYDYATTVDESFTCACGANDCRGAVSDFFALPRTVQARYVRRGAVPSFIMRKYKRHMTRR